MAQSEIRPLEAAPRCDRWGRAEKDAGSHRKDFRFILPSALIL